MISAKDWTLLAIGAAKGLSLTPAQLQKALFMLARNLDDAQRRTAGFYAFAPYDYGPFNADVYRDAQVLQQEGLIAIEPADGVTYRRYSATPSGLERCHQLRVSLQPTVAEYLDGVVEWVRSLSFSALVRAIYQAYPEMKANSVFRD